MNIHTRLYYHAADYQRVSDFLAHTYSLTQNQHNWGIDRWDFWCYFVRTLPHKKISSMGWETTVRLWETDAGELVGIAHPEDGGDVFLDIHPDYRHLEGEMLDWAEANLALPTEDGQKRCLNLFVYDYDTERQALLSARGYQQGEHSGFKHRRDMSQPIPEAPIPAGYTVRQLNPETDLPSRGAASNSAFNSQSTNPDVYRRLQSAPTYDPELDLVAVDSEGTVVSFTIIWWDARNRVGIFEPVGTHADHQRRGLAKAVLCEGFRRMEARQAVRAYVGSWTNTSALGLYKSVGFMPFTREYRWYKVF